MGTIATVDLTNRTTTTETVDPALEKKLIDGWGIGCTIAYDLIKPGLDPLSPENPIIIGTGTLVGTPVPSANQVFAMTKSTVQASKNGRTSICCGSGGSLRFGKNLKQAGYDFLVLKGKAETPSYLFIENDRIEICDASDLWGQKDLLETADFLTDKHPGCGVITIGGGGEKKVSYTMSMLDKVGTLGRAGIGAVLGSKQIKAIAVRGTKPVPVFDEEKLSRAVGSLRKEGIDRESLKAVRELAGHASWDRWLKTFNAGIWSNAEWDKHYGVEKFKEAKGRTSACDRCFLGCKTSLRVTDGAFAGTEVPAGYYMCVATLAQRLEIEDHRNGLKLLDLCNRAGLCFFTATSIVDWVTRLYVEGKISEQETGGLVLRRDFDAYLQLFTMIINREGLGDTLAQGWYATSERVGFDAVNDNHRVAIGKGFDPIVDARFWGLDSTAFAYFVSPRGHHGIAHSLQYGGNPIFEQEVLKNDLRKTGVSEDVVKRIFSPVPYYGKFNAARMTSHIEDRGAIIQALGVCDNLSAAGFFPMNRLAECYSAVTGIEISPQELKQAGERIHNLFKTLNVREGFSREDDTMPSWFKPIDTPDGTAVMKDYYGEQVISKDDVSKLLDDYYNERGWDKVRGVPTEEKLAELGLQEFIP
jgi:aldehyde:ferredoxin oxidoreductase